MTTSILEEWHEQRKNFNPSNPVSINQVHEFKEQVKLEEQTEGTYHSFSFDDFWRGLLSYVEKFTEH
ncbi:hypothetical protein [Lysinibacillus sp. NPDC047702]|uniref:hypothetical protein n=1 Tax=unclassified Lysinibacillus TaxID=2636778 RepID=UPI003D066E71